MTAWLERLSILGVTLSVCGAGIAALAGWWLVAIAFVLVAGLIFVVATNDA